MVLTTKEIKISMHCFNHKKNYKNIYKERRGKNRKSKA
jgi:hypothetical protein